MQKQKGRSKCQLNWAAVRNKKVTVLEICSITFNSWWTLCKCLFCSYFPADSIRIFRSWEWAVVDRKGFSCILFLQHELCCSREGVDLVVSTLHRGQSWGMWGKKKKKLWSQSPPWPLLSESQGEASTMGRVNFSGDSKLALGFIPLCKLSYFPHSLIHSIFKLFLKTYVLFFPFGES